MLLIAPNTRWLITSGTPGLSTSGELPKDITGQAELAWQHVKDMLHQSGMTVSDIVKVTQYLTSEEDIQLYAKVKSHFLGEIKPASMLLIVSELVWPEMLVEIEIIAARV